MARRTLFTMKADGTFVRGPDVSDNEFFWAVAGFWESGIRGKHAAKRRVETFRKDVSKRRKQERELLRPKAERLVREHGKSRAAQILGVGPARLNKILRGE